MVLRKRGVSAVVATVIIILISISSIAIVWISVMPLIQKSIPKEISSSVSLSIDTSQGFTAYDSQSKLLVVQVKRGTDKDEIKGVQFIMNINNQGYTLKTYSFPNSGTVKTFVINMSEYNQKPDSIMVAPLYGSVESLKIGIVSQEVKNVPLGVVDSSLISQGVLNFEKDCDEADEGKWQLLPGYLDFDKDGNGTGSILSVCSGYTLPLGYSFTSTDCNDSNASIWENKNFYLDSDKDGFGGTTSQMACSNGVTAPFGYSSVATDCNDTNENITYDPITSKCVQYFDSCLTLNKLNYIYRLKNSLINPIITASKCITISNNSIDLDCQGYQIYTINSGVALVSSTSCKHLIIRNCQLSSSLSSTTNKGVSIFTADNITLIDNIFNNKSQYGLYVYSSNNINIINNQFINNQ